MTAENPMTTLQREKGRKETENSKIVKTIIQLGLMLFVAAVFLFSGYITYSDETMSVPLTGGNAILSLFYGCKLGYVNYGNVVYITVPWYAVAVGLVCVAAPVGFAVWGAVEGFVKKRDVPVLGIAQMGFAAFLILFYVLCLTCDFIGATSGTGERLPFYKLYEIRPLFLLTAFLFLLAGGIQYGCRLTQIPAVKRFFPF